MYLYMYLYMYMYVCMYVYIYIYIYIYIYTPAQTRHTEACTGQLLEVSEARNRQNNIRCINSLQTSCCTHLLHRFVPQTILGMGTGMNVTANLHIAAGGPPAAVYCIRSRLQLQEHRHRPNGYLAQRIPSFFFLPAVLGSHAFFKSGE